MGRESKFELLRIVMTFMVITLHYLNPEMGGALEYTRGNEINHILALLLESVCIIAVNIFLIITVTKKTTNLKANVFLLS